MAYDDDHLNDAFDRTAGRCHICRTKLAWSNYGAPGRRGAWEIEHSVARARGGRDHGNNRFAACVSCNRRKGTRSSRSARTELGFRRAPLSAAREADLRLKRAVVGGTIGALLCAKLGPKASATGAIVGLLIGHGLDVD